MAEEDSFLDEEGGGKDLEVGKKVGFIPAFVIKILKYIAIAVAAILFIVTIVVVTFTIMNRGAKSKSVITASPEYSTSVPIYSWYDLDEIRGKTADTNSATVIVKAKIGYARDNKNVQTELVARTPQILDLIRRYFSTKLMSELGAEYEMEIKEELKRRINQIMNSGKVLDIAFIEYNIFEF